MKICIFPGTFNPIHNAHLRMAEFALKKFNFDKIIFIPSYIPPHKTVNSNMAEHRLNMTKLAVKYNPKFEVSDIEYRSDGVSYSVITVKKIIKQFALKEKLNFIIGTDAFVNLDKWYEPEELKRLVHFIVFPRRESNDKEKLTYYKQNGWDFEVTDSELMDISSTEIRNNAHSGNTNKKVEEYILNNGLYES